MKRTFIAILSCILFHIPANSQGLDSAIIRGCLVAQSSNEGVTDAYIKVTSKKRSYLLAYINTGKENCFSIKLPFVSEDSFLITVSHAIYQTTIASVFIAQAGRMESIEMVMPLQQNVLGGVTVKSPPVWVRGDTTFFKADFFKEGEERKLKDLIVKIPGFEIDKDGHLLYRKRRIEKIMIEGEELFADKIQLLLNSFPIHVLHTVQALENQSDNKLLKGLTADSKVFLNLGIKKEKMKMAFGDAEAGAGTKERYLLATTLFALHGKAKFGLVGNNNSTGSGFDWGAENELKNEAGADAENWMMNTQYLRLVNNFSSQRYIANRKWDNRLQANIPIGKDVKSQAEIGFVKDRQLQDAYYNSALYNDSFYLKRTDSTNARQTPLLFSARQELTWRIDSAKELKSSVQFYENASKSRFAGLFTENSDQYSTENSIRNKWTSVHSKSVLTHRVSPSLAAQWYLTASWQRFNQFGQGISPDWPSIFQLPDDNLTTLDQQLHHQSVSAKAGAEWLKKTKKGLLITGLNIGWSKYKIQNNTVFIDATNGDIAVKSPDFSNAGEYSVLNASGHAIRSLQVFHRPMNIKMEYGVARSTRNEPGVKDEFNTLLYAIEIGQQTDPSKRVTLNYSAGYGQKQAEPWNLYTIQQPRSISSFHRNAAVSRSLRAFRSNLSVGVNLGNFKTAYLGLSYNRAFTGFVPTSTIYRLLQVSADTLIRQPTGNLFVTGNIFIPSLWLKTTFEFSGGYSINKTYLVSQGQLYPAVYHWYNIMAILRKNWNKKYFIILETGVSGTKNTLSDKLTDNIAGEVLDLKISLRQRLVAGKNISVAGSIEWYQYNIFSGYNQPLLFADISCTYKLPVRRWSFSAVLSNITNRQFFYALDNSTLAQSFYSIPLIGRNAFISARYEL